MLTGIAFALAAGTLWGLVFIAPLLLPDYPAALLSCGRYLAFGLIALPLAWLDRRELAHLSRADWREALQLSLIGNVLYYLFLASAIQRTGGPLPTMLIGTLPVVIAISANLFNHQRDGHLPWSKLLPPLAVILAGIACVNQAELAALALQPGIDMARYGSGAIMALLAVACWTWYPIRNGNWLRAHPQRKPRGWATAQGLATLPLALLGYAGFWLYSAQVTPGFAMPLGPTPGKFMLMMLGVALLASWLGTLCWNEASQRLPTSLAGQLIVFETLAALTFAYLLRGQWPGGLSLAGIGLLLAGVMWAMRVRPEKAAPATALQ
jgi:drug/metabolite transporter (DMT)-like permease